MVKQFDGVFDAISIHALLAESDGTYSRDIPPKDLFLSTLSLRRATYPKRVNLYNDSNFYPRSPCGERQNGRFWMSSPKRFLSTLSLRRATKEYNRAVKGQVISIHALLAESDMPVVR